MGLIGWIILGALAGWIASLILKTNREQGWIGNIVLGIIGAIVGGFLWNKISDADESMELNVGSVVVAVIGALIVSFIYSKATGKRAV